MKVARILQSVALHAVLMAGAVATIFPFYYMFVLASWPAHKMFQWPPPLWFGDALLSNYQKLVGQTSIDFWRAMFNSAYVAIAHTVLVLFFCSIAGYAFAMYNFPGKKMLFNFMLATMMVPSVVGLIPWFIMMKWMGWYNTHWALIIPGVANAFGIFWMRQYVGSSVPRDLLDAARIDGCPEWQIFFRVVWRILMPAYGALGIMTFMGSWNSFMGPMLLLQDKELLTVPVALSRMRGDPARGFDQAVMMLGTALATLPILAVFLVSAKRFMAGLTAGAIKE